MEDQLRADTLKNDTASPKWFKGPATELSFQESGSSFITDTAHAQASRLAQSRVGLMQTQVHEEAMNKGLPGTRDVLNHANFGLLPVEKKPLGSLGVSLLVNGLIVAAVLVLTIAQVHEAHVRERKLELTFLAQPKPYVPPVIKVKMPPIPIPKTEAPKIIVPKPVVVPEPPKVEPIKVETKAPVIPVAAPRPVVAPPTPVVGRFSTPAPTAAPKLAAVTKPAGFGDPTGVAPNPNANRATNLPAVGGFGSSPVTASGGSPTRGVVQGAGFGAGAGAGSPNGSAHGVVASVGFGSGTQAGSPGARGAVSTAGFGNGPAAPSAGVARVQQPVTTAIVVLSKPLPQYTSEAREMHIEGDVTLEVRFTASGDVEVLRVVNGLGHGLDEQARFAAQKIRFKPATRDGKPVDQVSVIHVAFQLA